MEVQKTYVEILYPGSFFPEEDVIVVNKRDPKKISSKYPTAFSFQFYDLVSKEIEVDGEKQQVSGKKKNISPKYYPDGELYTANQLRKIDAKEYDILISNMECNGWKHVVKTRRGNFQPFEQGKDELL